MTLNTDTHIRTTQVHSKLLQQANPQSAQQKDGTHAVPKTHVFVDILQTTQADYYHSRNVSILKKSAHCTRQPLNSDEVFIQVFLFLVCLFPVTLPPKTRRNINAKYLSSLDNKPTEGAVISSRRRWPRSLSSSPVADCGEHQRERQTERGCHTVTLNLRSTMREGNKG